MQHAACNRHHVKRNRGRTPAAVDAAPGTVSHLAWYPTQHGIPFIAKATRARMHAKAKPHTPSRRDARCILRIVCCRCHAVGARTRWAAAARAARPETTDWSPQSAADPATCSMQQATRNRQHHATRSIEHATDNMQYAMQHATCNRQHPTPNPQCATEHMQQATCSMRDRHAACTHETDNMQPATDNMLSTCKRQH